MAVGPNIPRMERTYNILTNLNVGLLVFAGLIAVTISVVALFSVRKGGALIKAKDEESNTKLARLTAQTEEARAKQGEYEQQNLILRTDLANAQRALLELEERTRSRQITEQQKGRLAEMLRDSPPGSVSVTYASTDPEASVFAQQIVETLRLTKWEVTGPRPVPKKQLSLPAGLMIVVRDKYHVPPWATSLCNAFEAIGFKMEVGRRPELSDTIAEIYVGAKPSQ